MIFTEKGNQEFTPINANEGDVREREEQRVFPDGRCREVKGSDKKTEWAGFLEFKGEGLQTFERAMDRVERLPAVLGSRLLESQKRVSESAEALAIRQGGEASILGDLAKFAVGVADGCDAMGLLVAHGDS